MSTSQLFCIAAVLAFLLAVGPIAGWAAAFTGAYIVTLGGITTTIYVSVGGTAAGHYGIARSAPTLWLGDLMLLGALIAIWAKGGRIKSSWTLVCFVLPALVFLLVVWGNTPEQWSGFKLYVTAIASFGLGRWLSENLAEKAAFVIVCSCLIACGLQFLVTFAQSQGMILLGLASPETEIWISEGRMVGLYSHPAFLGKTMFLLFCFLLPLSTCQQRLTRRLAYLALGLGSVATLLTLSRANVFAVGVAIILWSILGRRVSTPAKRIGVLAVTAALVILNTTAIAEIQLRQALDPEGGYRQHIFEVGLKQIAKAPLTGTGPNYYSEVVGNYDNFAAKGFPLHNSFLYPVAELGVFLALVLFAPLILTVWTSIRRSIQRKQLDVQAVTLFSILPGVIAIAWTGWGMVGTEALPLWFMGFGFLATRNGTGYFAGREGASSEGPSARTQRSHMGMHRRTHV